MSWQIVKQPNGTLARFDGHDFSEWDMGDVEAVEVLVMKYGVPQAEAEAAVGSAMRDRSRWALVLEIFSQLHGRRVASERAMELSWK